MTDGWTTGGRTDAGRAIGVRLRRWGRTLAVGAGLVGGMATFVYTRPSLMPLRSLHWYPWVFVAASGLYPALLARRSLRRSLAAAVVGGLVGTAVVLVAWVLPAYLLPYPPAARDLLLAPLVQQAVAGALGVFFPGYLAAYLALLTVLGYLDL